MEYQQGNNIRSYEETTQEPMYPIADPSFLAARIEINTHINELKMGLRGYTQKETGEWEKLEEGTKPLLNDKGINVLIPIIRLWANTPGLFSEFSTDQINQKMVSFSFALMRELVSHELEWEIDSLELVQESIEHFVHSMLTRALNRGEARSIGQSVSIQKATYSPENKGSKIPLLGGIRR